MRGKVARNELRALQYGITPAYAGKSFPFFGIIRLHWDHPPICGEKLISVKGESRPVGSPPHMRGKAASPFAFTIFIRITPAHMRGKASVRSGTVRAGRITPAYAGKSTARRRAYLFFWDHPRICGEKWGLALPYPILKGITPAYAGKRTRNWRAYGCLWDHPRICGEKTKKIP